MSVFRIAAVFFTVLLLAGCAPADITTRQAVPVRQLPSAEEAAETLEILSLTESVPAGEYASLTVKGEPGILYAIAVHYASGISRAKGLEPAEADADGTAAWTWRVGHKTASGTYRITVTGGGRFADTYFTVE